MTYSLAFSIRQESAGSLENVVWIQPSASTALPFCFIRSMVLRPNILGVIMISEHSGFFTVTLKAFAGDHTIVLSRESQS